MAKIELVGGRHFAVVDDADFERVSAFRWYEHHSRGSKTVYAKAVRDEKTFYMHRVILEPLGAGDAVNHIDRDGLNNVKANLRVTTMADIPASRERDPTLASHIHKVVSLGHPYFYWQPKRGTNAAGSRIRLPNDPMSAEFWEQVRNLNAAHIGKQL